MLVLFQLTKVAFNLYHFLAGMTHELFQLYHLHIDLNSKDDFSTLSQPLGITPYRIFPSSLLAEW